MITFRVPSEELSSMLQSIARVVPSQDPNRLRTELLFEIDGTQLKITGSNPQFKMTGTIELAEASENCKFTIPPGDIVDYVKELPEQPLTFTYELDSELGRGPLTMNFSGGVIRFTATDGDTYPEFQETNSDDIQNLTIDSKSISEGLNAVLPAASQDPARRSLSGVCFRFYNDKLDIVATDSVILSLYTIRKQFLDELNESNSVSFVLPPSCAGFLKNFLSRYDGEQMQISFSKKSITFKIGTVEIESLLIDAPYPNYQSIIPFQCEYTLTMNTATLRNVVKRMVKFIPNEGIISLTAQPEGIVIKSEKNEENKLAEETIDAENPNGYTIPIYFDKKRLTITIDNIDTPNIVFKIIDNSRPIIIAPSVNVGDNELINLISAYAPSASH